VCLDALAFSPRKTGREEYNGNYWVDLHGNPATIGYKTLKSAEDFVDWMEGQK